MVMTPNSSASSYMSAAEFLKRADARTVGDLCSDDKTRITPTALLTDANLAAALLDASGELESALYVGQKYTPADVAALVAHGSSAGLGKLYRLLTAITKVMLIERRIGVSVPDDFMAGVDRAQKQLEALALGTNILSFVESAEAGTMDIEPATPADVTNRFSNVIQAERYFGTRSDRAVGPGGW